jgi:hypothetical protein
MKYKETKEYFLFINKKSTGIIESCDGSFHYASNGIFHYKNGELHREDGPAFEWTNGKKEWYLNGKHYYKNEYKIEIEKLRKSRILLK